MMKLSKFNWLDWTIAAIVLAALVFGSIILLAPAKTMSAPDTKKLYFVFETSEGTEGSANAWKDKVGTKVVFGETKSDKGIITKVEVLPWEKPVENALAGSWNTSPIAGKYVAWVTVEFEGVETQESFSGGQFQVDVGKETVVSGVGVNSEGYIMEVGAINE